MIGKTIRHYRITAKLGEGGMGAVYVAEDTELRREVALKLLPPETAGDPERLHRFRKEAQAVAALNHPNIVTIFSVEEADGIHFITMELVRGQSLGERISKDGMTADRLLELAVPLADAVGNAHKNGITHRDLKPDNVLIDEEGRVKVLDFGLAKLDQAMEEADATVTAEGRVLGTVAYMSPEQAQGQPVDPRSDVFSLGILLYEMSTGRRPFSGDNNLSIMTAILRDVPQSISESSSSLPSQLDAIVRKCLAKNPDDRYENAGALAADLEALRRDLVSGISSPAVQVPRPRRWSPWKPLTALVLIAAVALVSTFFIKRAAGKRWARTEALPQIEQMRDQAAGLAWGTVGWDALDLAREAERYIGDDPALERVWPMISREISITSEPAGAEVFAKAYADPFAEWRPLGRTPVENVRIPHGVSRLKIELAGYGVTEDLLLNHRKLDDTRSYALHAAAAIPPEMVFVPAGAFDLYLPGIDHLKTEPTADFLIDRYEVTNRQYKEFVDAGGYENRDYWNEPLIENGVELSWNDAMARFRDTTDRAGPAGWVVGDYASGDDDLPVAGVSWFEAAAYAEWAGKSLPTVFHWNRVALTWASGEIAPMSNFGRGLKPVGASQALTRYGTYDVAGNVREWTANATTRDDARFILGGGWNDEAYAFNDAYAQSGWDRSATNGFRCIRYAAPENATAALTRTIDVPFRDFYSEEPVSEETFAIYRGQFAYDRSPLNATIESEDEFDDWIRQRISFDAAYGDERVQAWLFLPRGTTPPYQGLVYFPGSNAIHTPSSAEITGDRYAHLMKSGRAMIFPIYKGTYERRDELDSDYPDETNFYKDHVIMWGKDMSRAIDYLEERDDIDTSRLAFYGVSWGGVMGTILPAIEDRIKVNVLYVAGLLFQRALPEVDQINYVTRVRQPTIMINGEFDFFFPVDTSQKPLHDLLGTPAEHKKYVVYRGGHSVPRGELVREQLAWLDRYQGSGG